MQKILYSIIALMIEFMHVLAAAATTTPQLQVLVLWERWLIAQTGKPRSPITLEYVLQMF